jgi:hypothetical protein
MPLETENEPTPVMTQEQCDAVAERIAAVLRETEKDRTRTNDAGARL